MYSPFPVIESLGAKVVEAAFNPHAMGYNYYIAFLTP